MLVGALLLSIGAAPLQAQTCPPPGSAIANIVRTTTAGNPTGPNQSQGLDGQVEVVYTSQYSFDAHVWSGRLVLNAYAGDGTLVYQTAAVEGQLVTGESYMAWLSNSMRYPYDPQHPASGPVEPPMGDFRLEMEWQLTSIANPNVTCSFKSAQVTRTLGNPLVSEALPSDKLNTVCGENHPHIPTGSETDPQDGGQSWSIPITSWPYKGSTYGLTATYFSEGMVDPKNPDVMNLAGLSEKNSHWTHNFAMWLTLPIDETTAGWAVVHRGLHPLTFKKPTSGNIYTSLNSFDTLTASSTNLSPMVTYPCNGTQVPTTISVPASFTLADQHRHHLQQLQPADAGRRPPRSRPERVPGGAGELCPLPGPVGHIQLRRRADPGTREPDQRQPSGRRRADLDDAVRVRHPGRGVRAARARHQ